MRFKTIDHPSDIGIEAYGENVKETFENTAFGMFSLMAEINDVAVKNSFEIKVKGEDWEELLVNWLNELIYIFDSKKVLLKEFRIYFLSDKELKANVSGDKINPKLHELHRPIKAATFNQLEVHEKKVKVIFDV